MRGRAWEKNVAEEKRKVRRIKKTETVREKAEKAASTPPKKRRLHRATSTVSPILKLTGKYIHRVLKPLRFLLIPFKTRPARFVGRILASILMFSYIRGAWQEMREVTWPSREETWKLALAVFTFAIAFGLVIAVVDYGLDKLFRSLLLQ
jgi:preprotein translocase SecE subunit